VLPVEGEYTIHVQNLRNVRTGVEIFVDAQGLENRRCLGLRPLGRRSLTLHTIQTEEEFEVDSVHKGSLGSSRVVRRFVLHRSVWLICRFVTTL
jgi:hypothetical protein